MKIIGRLAFGVLRNLALIFLGIAKKSPRVMSVARNVIFSSSELRRAMAILSGVNSSVGTSVVAASTAETEFQAKVRAGTLPHVTICVPVFNAFDSVSKCLGALSKTLGSAAEVIIVNDGSTDARIGELLEDFHQSFGWKIVTNERNLGYTKSVNKAISQAGQNDIILLNSDTYPVGNWVNLLRYAAYRDSRIATVTPFSDNSDAFSVPRQGVGNPPPKGWSIEQMALAVMQTGTGQLLDVPTGNGFCLFIKREVFDQIGLFDEVLFPRGYGEENEFCMRAAEQGWMNVVSDKVFVSHEGSSSFGEEKLELTRIGLERVQAKFPTYAILNKRIFDEEFHSFRSRVFNRLIGPVPKRRILFIQPISGGGLPFTNDDLSKGISDDLEQLRLTLNSQSNWQLERKSGGIWQFLEEEFRLVNPIASADSAFDSWFADLVFRFSVDIIHLEHSQWFSSTALRAAKPLVSCVTMSIHDYYSICPSTQLLDENLISCGGVCTKSQGQCSTPIDFAIEFPPLKDNFVHSWRSRQDAIFKTLDCIFGPTQSSLSRIGKFFDISSIQRVVVPHGRDDLSPTNRELNMSAGNAILVLGAIGLHKGAQLLPDLVHELGKYDIRVDLLGTTSKQFESTSFRNLGDYQRGEIERGVNPADYAFVLLPSIWEETFAHTISEAWSLGLPVVGFSLGAMEERLAGGGGRVLPLDLKDNAKLLASELKEIAADTKSLERMRLEAGRLATEIRKRSSRAMALDYLEVWNRLVK